jgi:hypothetical protein
MQSISYVLFINAKNKKNKGNITQHNIDTSLVIAVTILLFTATITISIPDLP